MLQWWREETFYIHFAPCACKNFKRDREKHTDAILLIVKKNYKSVKNQISKKKKNYWTCFVRGKSPQKYPNRLYLSYKYYKLCFIDNTVTHPPKKNLKFKPFKRVTQVLSITFRALVRQVKSHRDNLLNENLYIWFLCRKKLWFEHDV